MNPDNNVDSADAVLKLKNIIWAFPYLAVMGLIWGYLAGASSGAIVGLAAAAAISVLIGSATFIFAETPGGGAVKACFAPTRNTMRGRKHLASDLNVVRYHKLCLRFNDALLAVEEVLAKDPDFVEALLLKAQILWEGYQDGKAARACLLKILAVEPDDNAVFHRWALNLYQDLKVKDQSGQAY
ncbi:MAG: tetratricopeptide repeat protein [Desulfobacteraceae bacterium]|nr:tetratricopeptide repeat protein [Desulfobacteraceae bacterium]